MPFPLFILLAALAACLLVLALLVVFKWACDLMTSRWNGMHLYLGLKIYPKEPPDVQPE